MESIIVTRNLHKKYKNLHAVNNLNLSINRGDIYGFLGPNGAGKSTTLRMLMSLITPTSGEIEIFGKSLNHNRIEIMSKIGALIEKPDFYQYLSAYKNLELLSGISGIKTDKKKLMEILDLVGLEKRADSKVKAFSQGMKQRLGLAQALIHNPELIVLDEPANGLDPQGNKELRELILRLNQERKMTVIISSHILHEIELMCNRMVIINKGTTIVEGFVKELLNKEDLKVKFGINDTSKARQLLNDSQFKATTIEDSGSELIIETKQTDIAAINSYLTSNGLEINSIIQIRSLEEFFLNTI